ncbi:hypothetical protein K2O51_18335 [Cupriavidus pinatubonensis]|uniref:hypothetical protein n=1 Tax=Cupriavidus pinatubonensis TaxID=248026 RepID=UPI001129C772|nr:hypothetical protein [Cupriavidus pinatubonensis]QYY32724.1 hypothetical protein K2O51_18335 [Cupriavidus pinatubonensis]TPQ31350.1 hypothetical protein C2U69_29180 [Cupriavidus pinatubonensis]
MTIRSAAWPSLAWSSAEQIRNEILRRLQENADLVDACRDSEIPLPLRVDPGTNSGCNWRIEAFPGVTPACQAAVKAITAEMMREYDLP